MPDCSYSRIKMKEAGPVQHIVLSRPQKHNAFDEVTIREITEAFSRSAAKEKIRVILLEAEGKNFCAGADLEWMRRAKDFTHEENYQDALRLAEMIMTVFAVPKPVVCCVHGGVFGGGIGIVAACDVVIASDDATFQLSEVKVGIAPATISPVLLRKMGESVCRRIMLTGERFSAAEAKEFGLVHRVVPKEKLHIEADNIIGALLENSPKALASCKELMMNVSSMSIAGAKEYTADMIARLRLSEEGQEGLSAFLQKRKPSWVTEK